MKLILAQGNPEPQYSDTRHNIGFASLNALADKYNAKWVDKSRFNALVAEAIIGDEKILIAKPTTYYNETGTAARKLVDFYKIDPSGDLLVVHDDLALPFSTIRVREKGSDAGNNGIKSINSHIGPDYTRIRMGIDNDLRPLMDDADFVLSKFSVEESKALKNNVIPHVVRLIEDFAANKIDVTSYKNIKNRPEAVK